MTAAERQWIEDRIALAEAAWRAGNLAGLHAGFLLASSLAEPMPEWIVVAMLQMLRAHVHPKPTKDHPAPSAGNVAAESAPFWEAAEWFRTWKQDMQDLERFEAIEQAREMHRFAKDRLSDGVEPHAATSEAFLRRARRDTTTKTDPDDPGLYDGVARFLYARRGLERTGGAAVKKAAARVRSRPAGRYFGGFMARHLREQRQPRIKERKGEPAPAVLAGHATCQVPGCGELRPCPWHGVQPESRVTVPDDRGT